MTPVDVMTVHGPMRVWQEDRWVSRSLIELGEYSPGELDVIRMFVNTLQRSGRAVEFIEAGAYIGDLTVPISRLVGRVFAFEPNPAARELLEYNLKVNDCTNVVVFPYALGAETGTTRCDTPDPLSPGSNMLFTPTGETVQVVTLDSLDLPCDFLKADVEGFEVPLLCGGQNSISRQHPLLFMERDTVGMEGVQTLGEAYSILDYTGYNLQFPIYRPDNFNHNSVNNFGSTVSFMSLGIPNVHISRAEPVCPVLS